MRRLVLVFAIVAMTACSQSPPPEPDPAAVMKAPPDPVTGITGTVGAGPYYYFRNGATTPQGIARKVCLASDAGNWSAHIEVPNSWTARDCGAWVYQHMTRRPSARQQMGCVFDNGFSYGGFGFPVCQKPYQSYCHQPPEVTKWLPIHNNCGWVY